MMLEQLIGLVTVILFLLTSSSAFVGPHSRQCFSRSRFIYFLSSSGDKEVFFDDFGDGFSGDGRSKRSKDGGGDLLSGLRTRMGEVKGAEAAYDSRLARNWRRGNWSVRGFSLDKFSSSGKTINDDGGSSSVVCVSVVAAPISASFHSDISLSQDKSLQTVAVGRTDGSVFVIKIGEEYLTDFVVNDNDEAGMTRRADISDFVDEEDEQMGNNNKQAPFEIMHQFLASQQAHPINKLVYHDSIKGNDYLGIVCTAAGTTGEIAIWKLPSNDTNDRGITQSIVLSGIHNDEIISLKTIVLQSKQDDIDEQEVLFSASGDGKFALWNLRNGELLLSCQCAEDLMTISCADVFNPSSWDDSHSDSSGIDDDVIFLGTSSGYVCGYGIQELLTLSSKFRDNYKSEIINAVPSIRFRAHDAITAIACGGVGTIPSSSRVPTNPGMSSSILLTGGEDGTVKQWEILSQRGQSSSTSIRMEHWPRMPSQRMKRRAHVFTPSHDGPVICISQQSRQDTSKFLTCGRDGSVCVWNASTGKELFRMDGFNTVSSLACLGRELLVTDGMDDLVCVHDFGIADDAASNGYELEEW